MCRLSLCLGLVALLGLLSPATQAAPQNDKAPAPDCARLAQQTFELIDLVQKRSLEACEREVMLAGGVRAFLEAIGVAAPADLPGKLADIKSADQLAALLDGLWAKKTKDPKPELLSAVLFDGVLARLPGEPHWIPPFQLKAQEQITNNRYVGTGIQISFNKDEHYIQIPIPFRNGPAYKAGVKPGDLILEVDGRDARNAAIIDMVNWLRGEEGSPVTIVVRQPGATEKRTIRMIRSVVPFETVQGFRQTPGGWDYRIDPALPVAYVWMNAIRSSTLHELRQLEARLRGEGMRAIVLDLRSNTVDGTIQHAALVADGLLDGGMLWRIRDKEGQVKDYPADRECLFRNWPMVVIVDKDTRDIALNAVAAALQDQQRATIIGEASTYKGYVLTQIPGPSGNGAVFLPTGKLERAPGKSWPLMPDITVSLAEPQREAVAEWFRRKALPESPAGAAEKTPNDPQLARAVETVRKMLQKQELKGKDSND